MEPSSEARIKVPTTIRLDPAVQEKLKAMAEAGETTVSHLISSAIDVFLGEGGIGGAIISKEDLAAITPVVEAIGKPVPLTLFLEIMKTQRGS